MQKNITIIDVAREVGLSPTTVSCVLRGSAKGKVAPKTQLVIESAARKLGYRANIAARRLRNQKSYSIGILLASPASSFRAELIGKLQSLLMQRGYTGVFSFWDNAGDIEKATTSVLAESLDGIITCEPEYIPDNLDIPVVSYYNYDRRFDCVRHDFKEVVDRFFEYVMGLGHRKLGYIGLRHDPRYGEFIRGLKKRNLFCEPEWIYISSFRGNEYEIGYYGIENIFGSGNGDKPSALLLHNDNGVIGALKKAHELGIEVPGKLSVVGFDNISQATYHVPSITTFGGDKSESTANLLVELLFNRMKNPDAPCQIRKIETKLIERESSAPYKEM